MARRPTSFRLEDETLELLKREARRKGVSVTGLLNLIARAIQGKTLVVP